MPTTSNNQGTQGTGVGQPGGHHGGRGFAGMDAAQQRKIAQKGGEAVSRDRQHMSEIGRKGGAASGSNRGASQR